jgi:hypothetical protein
MQNEKQTVVVWQLVSTSPLAKALAVVAERLEKYSGRAHSVEYFAEECIARGIKAIDNSIKSGTELRNMRDYAKERANLATPPAGDADAMNAYFAAITRLDRKYGIGGTQVAL